MTEAEIGPRGLVYDREWLIVDKNNRFVSQREIVRMSLIKTAIDAARGCLTLSLPKAPDNTSTASSHGSAENFEILSLPLLKQSEDAETIAVTVWSDSAQATVESEETNAALSKYLGAEVRLVRMAPDYRRMVDARYAPGKDNIVGVCRRFSPADN